MSHITTLVIESNDAINQPKSMAAPKIYPLEKYKDVMDKIKKSYLEEEETKKNKYGYPIGKWAPEKEDPYAEEDSSGWNYKWEYKEPPIKKPTITPKVTPKNKKKATPKPSQPAPKPKPAADILDF